MIFTLDRTCGSDLRHDLFVGENTVAVTTLPRGHVVEVDLSRLATQAFDFD